jgi:Tfp pilus assembly protein PilX
MTRVPLNQSRNEVISPRRGGFIIVVMICLLVSGMLLTSLLKMALLQDRQLGCELARQQAAWLADSGLDRAAARLARDPAYAGESWNIAAAQLGGSDDALVEIRVQRDETRALHRAVVVEAIFSAEGPCPARITRQATIILSKEP